MEASAANGRHDIGGLACFVGLVRDMAGDKPIGAAEEGSGLFVVLGEEFDARLAIDAFVHGLVDARVLSPRAAAAFLVNLLFDTELKRFLDEEIQVVSP